MTLIEARNPRTGEVDFTFDAASSQSVAAQVERARAAQHVWSGQSLEFRVGVLTHWAEQLHEKEGLIREALAHDTGRSRISAEEIGAVSHMIHGYAAKAAEVLRPAGGPSSNVSDVDFEQQYVPYGVVGVISPWNFPVVLSFFDALPALIAGNAVVVKPSEVTPRFVEPLLATIDAIPELAGVVSIVRGGAETGQALIDAVDLVVFTGSIPTGRKVAEAAARNLIPAYLELGGKDPAIVTADADLDRAATSIVRSAVYNSGQVCYAIERVYVEEAAHDELVRLLVEKCESLDINFPDASRGEIGPFIFRDQARIVAEQLTDAKAKGARILTGGEVEDHGGLWMRATVVTGVTHDMRLMTEETFGPVIPVMKCDTIEQAVALANDTEFGLSGAVFAGTLEDGTRIAEQVNAGGVSINDTELPRAITLDGEKNAFGKSGSGGSRYGATAMLRYVRKKALIRNHGDVKSLSVLSEQAA